MLEEKEEASEASILASVLVPKEASKASTLPDDEEECNHKQKLQARE